MSGYRRLLVLIVFVLMCGRAVHGELHVDARVDLPGASGGVATTTLDPRTGLVFLATANGLLYAVNTTSVKITAIVPLDALVFFAFAHQDDSTQSSSIYLFTARSEVIEVSTQACAIVRRVDLSALIPAGSMGGFAKHDALLFLTGDESVQVVRLPSLDSAGAIALPHKSIPLYCALVGTQYLAISVSFDPHAWLYVADLSEMAVVQRVLLPDDAVDDTGKKLWPFAVEWVNTTRTDPMAGPYVVLSSFALSVVQDGQVSQTLRAPGVLSELACFDHARGDLIVLAGTTWRQYAFDSTSETVNQVASLDAATYQAATRHSCVLSSTTTTRQVLLGANYSNRTALLIASTN